MKYDQPEAFEDAERDYEAFDGGTVYRPDLHVRHGAEQGEIVLVHSLWVNRNLRYEVSLVTE